MRKIYTDSEYTCRLKTNELKRNKRVILKYKV